ncbi:MAG: septum formation protein Maf [Chitinispirillaceae bacterium]|nr:septum formation protein Maf [Chitinispirillaceae bacterium]
MTAWQNLRRPVILASQSPRRREILAQMGVSFQVIVPADLDEARYIDPADLVGSLQKLALAKTAGIAERHVDALVLGADTVVVKDGRVLGKPVDRREARAMLESLSGSIHQVMTGVALVCAAETFSASAVACTDVFFRKLTGDDIEAYLALCEYRDKAGAYAIQGKAMVFIEKITGCYYNVVGLPVAETISLFSEFSIRSGDSNERTS